MRRSRPDLIVPIRDRRQHRRILTLRNTAWVAGAILVLFIGVTMYSEFRRSTPGQYGGLMQRQAPGSGSPVPRVEPIREGAAVVEQPSADPMLLVPAARAQEFLGARPSAQQPPVRLSPPVPAAAQPEVAGSEIPPKPALIGSGGRVAIVSDSKGVRIVQSTTAPREKLSGGIFRPQ